MTYVIVMIACLMSTLGLSAPELTLRIHDANTSRIELEVSPLHVLAPYFLTVEVKGVTSPFDTERGRIDLRSGLAESGKYHYPNSDAVPVELFFGREAPMLKKQSTYELFIDGKAYGSLEINAAFVSLLKDGALVHLTRFKPAPPQTNSCPTVIFSKAQGVP